LGFVARFGLIEAQVMGNLDFLVDFSFPRPLLKKIV
jgi:hypothetical protein